MKKKLNQKTINKTILCCGTGIHSGKKVNIKIIPAKEDYGIVFKRTDFKKNNLILDVPLVFKNPFKVSKKNKRSGDEFNSRFKKS